MQVNSLRTIIIATAFTIFVFLYTNNSRIIRRIQNQIKKDIKYKYILLWTDSSKTPFVYLEEGNSAFKKRRCKFTNCFVTSDRYLLGTYADYHVIAFNGPQLLEVINVNDMPKMRSPHQKYVYANIEAAVNYPVCSHDIQNGFFNWTWTYKLNSDAIWGYILIRNSTKHIIGPSMNMKWISNDKMAPIDNDVKLKLANKSRICAWYVSNCNTMSGREQFFSTLDYSLGDYNLKIDVYGDCGEMLCPKNEMERCHANLQEKYYFYLAFENALSEDYVTEKILHALRHYTVPVVYGKGNYTRFMPPGSYLDALKLGPIGLARKMYQIMQNPELYYEFFKWRKYYSYHYRHEIPETDDYCRFCEMINDDDLMNKTTVYNDFSTWWNPTDPQMCPS